MVGAGPTSTMKSPQHDGDISASQDFGVVLGGSTPCFGPTFDGIDDGTVGIPADRPLLSARGSRLRDRRTARSPWNCG